MWLAGLTLVACVNESDLGPGNPGSDDDPLAALDVEDDFDYSTSKNLRVELDVPLFLNNAVVSLYAKTGEQDSVAVGRGGFDQAGHLEKNLVLSARADSLLVFFGLPGIGQRSAFGRGRRTACL